MEEMFPNNIQSVWQLNSVVVFVAIAFVFFPVVIEENITKASAYILVAVVAFIIAFVSNRLNKLYKKEKTISKPLTYFLMGLGYANVMAFGIYVGILYNPHNLAVMFMIFLVAALFLYINSPLMNLSFTLSAMIIFIIITVIAKDTYSWTFDVINVFIAGIVSTVLTWYSTRYRILAEINAFNYYKQSTIDELTQLKNRRDFMQTFRRYLSNYRETDKFLCLAILDIDWFKDYNDCYGHPTGDDCLRALGKMFNTLRDETNLYAARIGGEEFACLWFLEDKNDVNNIPARIHKDVANLNIPHEKSLTAPVVTLSVGVHITPCGVTYDTHEIYKSADTALYQAKEQGRNRSVINPSLSCN
jgi:diguanylate cyclase (GGDEF)-like protein